MHTPYRDFILTRRLRLGVLALAGSLALTACGGGGGSPGVVGGSATGTGTTPATPATPTPTPVAATPTVTLAFVDAAGAASNSLTGATPLTARATVKDKDGKPVAGAIVSFATDAALGLFSPAAGTSLTDANGVASVTLRSASLAAGGAAKVTASVSVAGATVSSDANYAVGATTLTFGTLAVAPASIQAYGSTTLSVDVLSNGAKYTAQQVNVNFSSACVAAGKASLAATVATNNGSAQAVYRDLGCGNNDVITVAADGVTKAATAALAIAAPTAASVQFSAASPTNQSIVIAGQGGLGRTETATLTFKVFDIFNHPLVGQRVDFKASTTAVTLNKAFDTTDQNGEVITTVNSGAVPTTFRISATLPNTTVSTTSDSIVVTSGLPDQAHMSLSATTYNTDGWNVDSGTATPASIINVLLADKFGNPVPDGTPVVFQSNLGAVGSASKGGCNTVNGGCSVDFRTQAPRVATPGQPATPCNTGPGSAPDSTRVGLATVCASTSDGVNTLFTKVGIFFGSNAAAALYNNVTPLTPNSATPFDLGTISVTSSKVFTLLLSDNNSNPLPLGSSVAVTNLSNATADAPSPAVVPNVPPHSLAGDDPTGANLSGNQGSAHTFTIKPVKTDICVPTTATFNVVVTTGPGTSRAVSTTFTFKLAVSCS